MTAREEHQKKEAQQEIAFLEAIRLRCPTYIPLLIPLGDLYTRHGRFQDGLEVDLELADLCPEDETVWYNLACSYSLTNRIDEGMVALEKAVGFGYDDPEHCREDRDLDNLRSHPEFGVLMQRLQTLDPS